MAFYNNFHGDAESLKIYDDVIAKKSILIPGISCHEGISISEYGDKAYYFNHGATEIDYDLAGKQVQFSSTGSNREMVSLDHALYIKDVLPEADKITSVSEVADRVEFQLTKAINLQNKKGLEFLMANGTDVQDYEELTDANAFEKLIGVIEDFKLNNKNKGLVPSAGFISNAAMIHLYSDAKFCRFADAAKQFPEYKNLVAIIGQCFLFEAPDMDDDADFDFIILDSKAFVAPLNLITMGLSPAIACGYPNGKIVSGEIRVGFKVADAGAVLIKKNHIALKAPKLGFAENHEEVTWAAVSGATGYVVDDNGSVQEEQEELSYSLVFATTEKYIAVKAVSTDEAHESEGPFSDKLLYQQRQAPELSIEDGLLSIEDPDSEEGFGKFDIYVDDELVEEEWDELEYDLTGLELEPGTHEVYAKSMEFIEEGKLWASSDNSQVVEYVIPEPEEPEAEE